MADTLLRQWILLRSIPRYPRKITVPELDEALQEAGIHTTRRTIERDLQYLSRLFPLVSDERNRPYGWSWDQLAPQLDVPGMGPETALSFKILEQFAQHLLPRHILDTLSPHLTRAGQVLDALDPEDGLRVWPGRVRVLPRTQQLLGPEVDPDIVATVYEALLQRRCFELRYRSRKHRSEQRYQVHPLGLLFRDQVTYLVCTLWEYDDIRQLALHRMRHIALLDAPAREPEGFDMDDYIRKGGFTYEAEGAIRLRARFSPHAAYHLYETPLSKDQTLTEVGERVEVTATVLDSQPLRWWLRAFGDQVEVLAPADLRAELAREAEALAQRYRTGRPAPE